MAALPEDWKNGGFGIYIHWPFCESKCPYCDFNSHVAREIDQTQWRDAYLIEIDRYADQFSDRILDSVFFGGGTPSLMDPSTVDAIMDRIQRRWRIANDFEVTLEANPGSVEAGRFAAYRLAGVNRVSMGIQALNDDDLNKLGRLHSVSEALAAFDIARGHFDRVSFDLIYARQNQTLNQWESELKRALSLAVDHLSAYQLTVESNTRFGDLYSAGKLRGLPSDDVSADMYQLTQDICAAHDMPTYEISNHAKYGAESHHNKVYWKYGDYIGIGPGAHGRLTISGQRIATQSWSNPNTWLTKAAAGSPYRECEALGGHEQAQEFLMMGLRLVEGISASRFASLAKQELNADKIFHLSDMGLLEKNGDRISATPDGRIVLNFILRELLANMG